MEDNLNLIAIVGLAGRFPKAKNVNQFWQNLRDGVTGITEFSWEELSDRVDPSLLKNKDYVQANYILDNIEWFDAPFFNFTPREAEITDPQHRILLECAWEALEDANVVSDGFAGAIGVFAGSDLNTYLLFNLAGHNPLNSQNYFEMSVANDKDYLATKISYKLNLTGPSVTVQTACSTSLVAVHLACQSLLDYQCDLALAGGVSITVPQQRGYLYQEGGALSPDGYCRAFDAKAGGTVGGNGAGLVVLKRLGEAVADGDYIYAVIRGSAIDNDGAAKVGYTAPSIEGQAQAIAEALEVAEVNPETIRYIEAHGTGTALGDPIEIAALTKAFRGSTDKIGFCAIGSVKTNIGHLNTAAGIAGLLKTVLAIDRGILPPSLHFQTPNPKIDFANSPFYVNDRLVEWRGDGVPRRAGVSAFGFGGTNAHLVLEQAPAVVPAEPSRFRHLLLLSAKTLSALDTATVNLCNHLQHHPNINLADVAYSLQVGRTGFNYRRAAVVQTIEEAVDVLATPTLPPVRTQGRQGKEPPVAFMFPGQGAQYPNMARGLYESEPHFKATLDRCCKLLEPHLEIDLRSLLYPDAKFVETASQQLQKTALAQPTLFAIEYALAQLWMSWGLQPNALIGHSIGEYVAATLAGVFSLEAALGLVAARGRLMQRMPAGAMLAVSLSAEELQPQLSPDLTLAIHNAPLACVVSGTTQAITRLENELKSKGVGTRRLHTSHAFHSPMMESMLAPFLERVKAVTRSAPRLPLLSNVTGTWMSAAQATNCSYWVEHLRSTVRFSEGIRTLLERPEQILLEVGPGITLSQLAKQHLSEDKENGIFASVRHPKNPQSDDAVLLDTLGQLWLAGVEIDWSGFYRNDRRNHVHLPTYPFERQRYWVEAQEHSTLIIDQSDGLREPTSHNGMAVSKTLAKNPDLADWFYAPVWRRSHLPTPASTPSKCWLLLRDECGLGAGLAQKLEQNGHRVILACKGTKYRQVGEQHYTIDPGQPEHYETLLRELRDCDCSPDAVAHLWSVTPPEETNSAEATDILLERGFYSQLFLARTLGKQARTQELPIVVFSNNMQAVTGEESLSPVKATLLGPVRTMPLEFPGLRCRSIDIVLPPQGSWQAEQLLDRLLAELQACDDETAIAYRGLHRWVQRVNPLRLEKIDPPPHLREKGVYWLVGGLGAIGLTLAAHLARTVGARLVLTGRFGLPPREEWEQWRGDDSIGRQIQQIQEIEALGADIWVTKADVCDRTAMQQAFDRARERFGTIHGVIHCAGVLDDGTIEQSSRNRLERVLAPKVQGTLVLEQILSDTELDFFIFCSSGTVFHPLFGQTAYCAANNFLDAFAHYKWAKDGAFALSIDWEGWQGSGMGMEGTKYLHHPGRTDTSGDRQDISSALLNHPLLDSYRVEGEQGIYHSCLSASQHWVLDEHRLGGRATLPGTAYLELVRAACEHHLGVSTPELRNIYFLSPLAAPEGRTVAVQTSLSPCPGGWTFVVQSAEPGGDWRDCARGEVVLVPTPTTRSHDLEALRSQCGDRLFSKSEIASSEQERMATYGLRWRNLQEVHWARDRGLAVLELPLEFWGDLDHYDLHPALLDNATGVLTHQYEGAYLPFFYKRLSLHGKLPAHVYSYIREAKNSLFHPVGERQSAVTPPNQPQTNMLRFDITIMDETGTVLVEIEDYTLKQSRPPLQTAETVAEKSTTSIENVELAIASPGDLTTLGFRPATRRPPQAGEVEIEVKATGVNFKEVLLALGLMPTWFEHSHSPQFGLECSGVIASVGEGVAEWQVGDAVMGFGASCYSRFITTAAEFIANKPENLTWEDAATLPVAFTTAYYALIQLGRLQAGEKVLIHAASGGVGQAAVQIAQWIGAEIWATAGSPQKREFLRSQGIEWVMDSRSLSFAEEVMNSTGGRGIDVVLNCLGGEFIPKSLSVLAPYGRFLELGQRDILNDAPLGLRPFAKNLSFFAINLDLAHPHFSKLWGQVMSHIREGSFVPLHQQVFSNSTVAEAFEFVSQARHMGKVVVSWPERESFDELVACSSQSPRSKRMKLTPTPTETHSNGTPQSLTHWLSPSEGVEVFDRVLGCTLPQIIVSTIDFADRGRREVSLSPQPAQTEEASSPPQHPRPELSSAYQAPTNEREEILVQIWQEMLRMALIGIHDNFFELGGDSLIAVQVMAKIRAAFNIDLPGSSLFEASTIAALAAAINDARSETKDGSSGALGEALIPASADRVEIEL